MPLQRRSYPSLRVAHFTRTNIITREQHDTHSHNTIVALNRSDERRRWKQTKITESSSVRSFMWMMCVMLVMAKKQSVIAKRETKERREKKLISKYYFCLFEIDCCVHSTSPTRSIETNKMTITAVLCRILEPFEVWPIVFRLFNIKLRVIV